MFQDQKASLAVLGYRHAPRVRASEIVTAIDAILQMTDAQPRRIHWADDTIAMIDRPDMRIAIGLLPADDDDRYTYLVLAIGTAPDQDAPEGDTMLALSCIHLADRLVGRIRQDMPYDTVRRGETDRPVDEALMRALFKRMRRAPRPAQAAPNPDAAHDLPSDTFAIIHADEVPGARTRPPRWMRRRASPTLPLRLTVHTVALSIMLYTAPLGAFLFTYSLLRDIVRET